MSPNRRLDSLISSNPLEPDAVIAMPPWDAVKKTCSALRSPSAPFHGDPNALWRGYAHLVELSGELLATADLDGAGRGQGIRRAGQETLEHDQFALVAHRHDKATTCCVDA